MIRLYISRADAMIRESETLTSGRVGLQCGFEFSSDWTGLGKTAVFVAGSVTKTAVVSGNNIVEVPWECLENSGVNLKVGVYGTNADEADMIVIPTVWCGIDMILKGTEISGTESASVTPTLAQQVLANSQAAVSAVITNVTVDDSEAGIVGTPDVTITDTTGVGSRTLKFKFSNLKGAKGATGATGPAGTTEWSGITGKPSTFPPSTHTHAWSAITDKPSTFAPSSHSHVMEDITDLPSIPQSADDITYGESTVADALDSQSESIYALKNVNTGTLNDSRYPVSDGETYCDYETENDIKELIASIAKSYYSARGTSSAPNFKYDQKKTPLDPAYDSSEKYMDCSTFVQLVISGTSYNDSPYCGKELSCTEIWGILPITSGVRTAAGMGKAFNACGCAVDISDGFDNVEIGDIVFFAKGTRENRYMGISHCTIVASEKSDGTHGMYECTTIKPYILNRVLEKTYTSSDGSIGQSPDQVVLIVRPRYIARAYSDYYTKSEIDDKLDGTVTNADLSEAVATKISEPTSDGTSGQVLTTDGNGGRYWGTVSGVTAESVTYDSSATYTNGTVGKALQVESEAIDALENTVGESPLSEETGLRILELVEDSLGGYSSLVDLVIKLPQDNAGQEIISKLTAEKNILSDILTSLEEGIRHVNHV